MSYLIRASAFVGAALGVATACSGQQVTIDSIKLARVGGLYLQIGRAHV